MAIVIESILYTWITNNTGRSILSAILFHFVGNAFGQLFALSYRAEVYGQLLSIPAVVLVVAVWGARTLTRGEKAVQPADQRAGSPYVVRLLAAFEAEPPPQETLEAAEAGLPEEVSQPVIEPLTERELEVLEELSRGLTNPEIAERLMVSLNTVKTHTRNISGKLGVRNRTEAAVRAQELGLLEA